MENLVAKEISTGVPPQHINISNPKNNVVKGKGIDE